MTFPIRTVLMLLGLGAAVSALTACNTTEGAGKDISATGKAISHEAVKASP